MLPIRRILVPVNFTSACRASAEFARDLAGSLDAEMFLLHVIEPAASATGLETAAVFEASMRGLREHATRTLDAFLEQADESVRRCVLEGDPASEIVRFARNERVDLILMPTHGYGVFRRLLLGSVTAKVLHDADCPVWTGLHPERCDNAGVISIRKVACAVDLGPQTNAALQWAARFAKHWNAALDIIHVIAPVPEDSWRERLTKLAHEQLIGYLSDIGADANVHIEAGDVHRAIPEIATRLSADLLVIARGRISNARLGGGAYAIVRDSASPVVSV